MKNRYRNIAYLLAILVTCLNGTLIAQSNFSCSSDLYQVVNGKDLKVLDPATGVYTTIGTSSINYNGAGFNYEDGYIYGIGSGNVLVRIDNTGQATDLGAITDFSALSYSGDLDTLGNWYGFRKVSGNWILNEIDVSAASPTAIEYSVTELSGEGSAGNCADISYNPISHKFYGMSSGKLTEFDPTNRTVKVIADYSASAESGSYGAVWSDNEGNTYFFNNNTGNIYKAAIDANGDIQNFGFTAVSAPNGSNDGMGCPMAAPPVFPEICDNGLDDDGDGLIDCEDPDCTSTVSCGVSTVLFSSDSTCQSGIVTYHAFFTNNSTITNTVTVTETLPTGFIFLQDTLEFDDAGTSDFTLQPVEGDVGTIQWGNITLNGGETVRISYDVTLAGGTANGTYTNSVTASLGNAGTIVDPVTSTSDVIIGDCPTPDNYQCEPAFYQVYKKRGKNQPNVFGRLNPITGDYDQIAIASDYANGLGFDLSTGLVYGACGKKFIQLDENGFVLDQGITFNKKVYRGDINENSEWYGVDGSDMKVIDVSGTPTLTATYVGQGLPGWDIAYNKNGNFYSVTATTLYKFDTSTNTKSTVATLTGSGIPTSGGYGGQWTGSDGYLYASHNATGKIVRVDVTDGTCRVVSSSIDGLSKNDGFSCPIQIPAVYEFDYGDNSRLPQSRVLSYYQDLSNDGLPDYATVWLGNTVLYDSTDPANADADGDTDDGVSFNSHVTNDTLTISIGLNTNEALDAHYCIGIDWDDDGAFDVVVNDSLAISTAQTINPEFALPEGFIIGNVNLRVLIADEALSASSISGDILSMGEVEDYRLLVTSPEDCNNGIDDDGDGLTDCDDPDCSEEAHCEDLGGTNSGGEGGLESNDRLAKKIAKVQFLRNKFGKVSYDDKTQLQRIQRDEKYAAKVANRNVNISHFIPLDVIEGTESYVTSPTHLTDMTNAREVFSVDVFEGDKRVAAVLAVDSENGVYEHTKYMCDRLGGSRLEDILEYSIDGTNDFHIAKMRLPNGDIEYATSFSIRPNESSLYELESFWNLEWYTPEVEFYNFQIWANNTEKLTRLANEIIRLVETQNSINSYSFGPLPKVFVNEANIQAGQLELELTNKNGETELLLSGEYSETETSVKLPFETRLGLEGFEKEDATIEVGAVYDLGVTIHDSENNIPDVIFNAQGSWGTDFDTSVETVNHFEVIADYNTEANVLPLERNIEISGQVTKSVAVFRAFNPSWRSTDVSDYSSMSFIASGEGQVEVTLVKSSVNEWVKQPRVTIELGESKVFQIPFDAFVDINGDTKTWEDLTMVVFDIKGNESNAQPFNMEVSNVVFRNNVITSTSDEYKTSDIAVYPNPVNTAMNVSFSGDMNFEKYSIELYSSDGRLAKIKEGSRLSGENTIQLLDLPQNNGLYFYRVSFDDIVQQSGKILIER